MANPDENLRYSKEHIWLKFTDEKTAMLGITNYAQEALGELVFVNLPEIGQIFSIGESFADVESAKVVSDVISPINGTVKDINEELRENPALINDSPYDSWIAVFSDITAVDSLLTLEEYESFCSELD